MGDGVRCMWMRGGTSKGGYFLADDLPQDAEARDAFLLRAMGSPDPLTSKVAVVRRSAREGVDVDYLFLQVFVDQAIVTDAQNCGNILAGVAPFAIERGLVEAGERQTSVVIYMENTGQIAVAHVDTPAGVVSYEGSASPVPITFNETAGSSCGELLPTGHEVDVIDGVDVTCIDNGMPVVVMRASDLGIAGDESREALDADGALKTKLESIRLQAGPRMNLGDVAEKSVPKMTLVSAPQAGGAINTRTFIPHRCHASIGVLGAVSVATACLLPDSSAAGLAEIPGGSLKELRIEHPSGTTTTLLEVDEAGGVESAAILRTARKLFDGTIFAHANHWGETSAMDTDYLPFHPNPSQPEFVPPAGAVDAHCHVFGPAAQFPYAPERKYTPCDAPKEKLFELRDYLGFERNVIVQASCHGRDNSALLNALRSAGERARGVAVVDPNIGSDELREMDEAGVRAVRFNFVKRLVDAIPQETLLEIAEKIAGLGWHIVVYFEASDLHELLPFLQQLPTVVVVDHMGRPDVSKGIDHPDFQRLVGLLAENENFWTKVSCPERLSSSIPDYEDVIPYASYLVERFPQRVLWGTDWPHPNMKSHMPDDGRLVDLIPRIAAASEQQQSLLVDSPGRLYWP